MIKSVHAVIIIAVLTLLPPVMPAANGESPESARTGLLAKLPSAPGAHVARIQALADGGWLNLGAPAPDSKWGTPPGRSYTCKMAAAPDLGGGFLYGEGPHGGTETRGGRELYNDARVPARPIGWPHVRPAPKTVLGNRYQQPGLRAATRP